MNQLRYYLPLAFLYSILFSMIFYESARAWMSISMFGMLGCVIFTNSPQLLLSNFITKRAFVSIGLSGILLFFFLPQSNNFDYAWQRIAIRGALLGLAIAFASLPKWSKRDVEFALFTYVLLAFGVCTYTLFNYIQFYEEINHDYLQAKVMPTILNHVRFSIMIAMACYLSYYLYKQQLRIGFITPKLLLVLSILLAVFIHVYSVRSGLIALYGMAVVELYLYLRSSKKYVIGGLAVIVVTAILVIAVQIIPTLNNKWENTKVDYTTYVNGTYPNYSSITTRLISFDAAIDIWKKSPLIGCGIGDIKDETDAYFKEYYPMIDVPILPHNQFLFYLAATGLLGLILFIITFYFPLFYKQGYKNKLLLMQYVVLTLSFLTEPMQETQLGMAYTVLFLMIPLNQLYGQTLAEQM
jgi:O-antigen ligase